MLRLAVEVEEEENGIEARREGRFGNEKRPAIAVPAKNRRQTHFWFWQRNIYFTHVAVACSFYISLSRVERTTSPQSALQIAIAAACTSDYYWQIHIYIYRYKVASYFLLSRFAVRRSWQNSGKMFWVWLSSIAYSKLIVRCCLVFPNSMKK